MKGGWSPFGPKPQPQLSEKAAERAKIEAGKPSDGTGFSTGEKALKVASTITLLAAVAGNAPLVGPILSGVLAVAAQVARAKGFSQRSKRYAHEMTADVKLTSALIALLVELRNKVNVRFNTDAIKDAAADVSDRIKSINSPTEGLFAASMNIAGAEHMLNELKEAMQDLKNNVTTAYIAVDLEMSSQGKSIRDVVNGDVKIKEAWEAYVDAQNPDPPAPQGGRKSRRRRSRKGKTFRRKRQ